MVRDRKIIQTLRNQLLTRAHTGTLLTQLLEEHDPSTITVLIRKPEQRQLFTTLGINIVEGSMSDTALLKSLASEHDVVVNFAVAFFGDEASIQALVDGLEERASKTGTKPVYLHTGGTGTVMYGEGGKAGSDIWTVSGLSPDHIRVSHVGSAGRAIRSMVIFA